MKKGRIAKRMQALALALLLVFTLLPDTAYAAAENGGGRAAAPKSITIDVTGSKHCIGEERNILVGKSGETFQFKAYDENGEETPVTWANSNSYAGTIEENSGLFTAPSSLSSGSSSFSTIAATSTLDSTVSATKRYTLTGFEASQYQKNPTVALSADGQTAKTISATAGYSGYCSWSYDEEAARGIAEPAAPAGAAGSWKFNAYRPGSFTVTVEAAFDPELKETVTLHITGVAVEDAAGNRGKVYLESTAENPNPTTQLAAFLEEGKTIVSWESSKPDVAAVDENGLVKAVGVGTAQITVTDSAGTKGGIKIVVKDGDTPYFESLEFMTSAFVSGTWTKDKTFEPKTLSYNLPIRTATTSQLTLQATTLYDTEKHIATASYVDIDGEKEEVLINSGKITYLKNLPFDDFDVTISIADKARPSSKTEYVFHVNRPRDTTKALKNSGLCLVPEGRNLYANTVKYNNYAEGTFLKADETGALTSGTGVSGSQYYYRTLLLSGTQAFALNITGNTAYMHLRYSVDDGASWKEIASGDNTESISFLKAVSESANPVQKVRIQILDDKTYHENVAAGKEGFEGASPNEYVVWVEQVKASPREAALVSFMGEGGDWYPETVREGVSAYTMVVPTGTTSAAVEYTVTKGTTVKLGTAEQTPDEKGKYRLNLKSSAQTVNITSADGTLTNAYTFKYTARSKYDVPDRVVDYFVPNSQYTNGGYGVNPETTLAGSMKSLGNFGGYITYYYEKPLVNNSKNPYGIDFFVYGNANVDTSSSSGCSFFEPAQVWVSENGSDWYALAGSEHYEKSTVWDYEVTYTRAANGKTAWVDNQGNSNPGSSYCGVFPDSSLYHMNSLVKGDSFTLKGICLPDSDGKIGSYGTSADANHVSWGYADCFANGTMGEAVNPYLDNSNHQLKANGFDLAWAVDGQGNPVDVSNKEFHYVKLVTASNMYHSAFGEKSPEIACVIRAGEAEEGVGQTKAASGVTLSNGEETKNISFESGKQIYEVNVGDMKYVSLQVNGASEGDNIYINNQRISYAETADGIKVVKENGATLVRVLVQQGEMEPEIYLLKLTGTASESDELIDSLRAKINESSRYIATKDGEHYALTVSHRIEEISLNPIVKKGVSYTIYEGTGTGGAAPGTKESYALSYGENTFTIMASDEGGRKQTITLVVIREAAPVFSGETIDVTFTLYGDSKHGNTEKRHTYQNRKEELEVWIGETTYTIPKESTVLDVLEKAFNDHEIPYTNADGNYISRIKGLAEMDNGPFSGWMYMINGKYPNKGAAAQTLQDGDAIIFHYTDDYTKEHAINEANVDTAEEVETLINAIGQVTLKRKAAIDAARKGYEGLTETQKELVSNYAVLLDAEAVYTELKEAQDILDEKLRPVTEVYEKTGAYLAGLQPGTGQVGGEWLVLGLARSKTGLSEESKKAYLGALRKHVRENCNGENRLSSNKSTENSRVILALTSLLYNTGYFEGKDLLAGLSDMEYLKKQGINGPIWALLAFDSNEYEIPLLKGEGTQVTREGLIAEILRKQLADGGFALSGESADADITGMALQALAPYCASREDVRAAVDRALTCLSNMQLATGGYANWGEANMESNAQVLAALSALGIDCRTDVRFVKDGNSLLDAMMEFALEDGTFAHGTGSSETDLMATEQAYYALTAYYRFLEEKNSLYDMKDVEDGIQTGDVNGDGAIDSRDALAVLKFSVNIEQEIFVKRVSECDDTEGINSRDALMILQYSVHLIDSFPVKSEE